MTTITAHPVQLSDPAQRACELVMRSLGTTMDQLRVPRRSGPALLACALIARLCQEHARMTLCEIAHLLGYKDHTTVMYLRNRLRAGKMDPIAMRCGHARATDLYDLLDRRMRMRVVDDAEAHR